MAVTCTRAHCWQADTILYYMLSQPQSQSAPGKKIDYKKGSYTEAIISWLEQHPEYRRLLFSDNIQDANAEGRRMKTGKHPKQHYYSMIAQAVFANDVVHKDAYALGPLKYSKLVENHVQV